jgi:hypothetical protein
MSVSCVSACGDSDAEEAALGIAELVVDESQTGIAIQGLDADRNLLAEVRLRVGTVETLEDARVVQGRALHVRVGPTASVDHASEGFEQLVLPSASPEIDRFLRLPQVAAGLARWGVRFELASLPAAAVAFAPIVASNDESQYWTCSSLPNEGSDGSNCTTSTFGGCSSSNGAVMWNDSGSLYYEFRCCVSGAETDGMYKRACVSPSASTPCGMAGPQGCAVCWRYGPSCSNCSVSDNGGGACSYEEYDLVCGGYLSSCNANYHCCSGWCDFGGGYCNEVM